MSSYPTNVLKNMGEQEKAPSISERVLAIVRDVLALEHNSNNILDASFKDDLTLTSLEQLTLFIALEDEFDRRIPQEQVSHIDSVQEIIDYIKVNVKKTA